MRSRCYSCGGRRELERVAAGEGLCASCEARETADAEAIRNALHNLVYGGEFAAWMARENPELPLAAAREYDEACNLMTRIVGHPPRHTTEPTMPKRTTEANEQITTARQMPSGGDDDSDRDRPDSQQCKDAERPAESHPGAPSKLPGYGR